MISQLKQLGLTEYESRVYETLLKLGKATGGEITRKSKVPHGKTYESLHNLSDKGLIIIIPLEPKVFKVIPPKESIKNMIERNTSRLKEIEKVITKSIKQPIQKEESIQKIEIYSGPKKQFEIANDMIKTAKKELLIISRGEKVPNSLLIETKKIVKKGRDFRIIVYDTTQKEWIKKFKKAGMKVKYFNTGDFTLAIQDRKKFMQVVKNPKNPDDRIVILFKDQAIVKAMVTYFNTIWKKGKKI